MRSSFEYWQALCNAASAKQEVQTFYDALASDYQGRGYHNLGHIEHCLIEFDQQRSSCAQPISVEFAIWYHDVVYDPRATNNESRSADRAVFDLTGMGVSDEIAQNAARLILATAHLDTPIDYDACLLVDIDLSILGQPSDIFDQYETGIREEYSWVPEDVFRKKRKAVLEGFLSREKIYHTDYYQQEYETVAKNNLQRSVTLLGD